jgi:hypothetical protein
MSYGVKTMEGLFPPRYKENKEPGAQWHISSTTDGAGFVKFTTNMMHSRIVWRLPVQAEQVHARYEGGEGPPPLVDAWGDLSFPIGLANISPVSPYGWDVAAKDNLKSDMLSLNNPLEMDVVGLVRSMRAISNVSGYPSIYLTHDGILMRYAHAATRIELPEPLPIEPESVLEACPTGFLLFCRIVTMLIDGDENLTATVSKSVLQCDPTYRLRVEAESGAWVAIDLHLLDGDAVAVIRDEFEAAALDMTAHAAFDAAKLIRKIRRDAIVRLDISEGQARVVWKAEDMTQSGYVKATTSGAGVFHLFSEGLIFALELSQQVTLSFGKMGSSALLQSADGTVQTVLLPALPYALWDAQRSKINPYAPTNLE